jgi:Ni/Fe-hydrogenase subunit HybB-like protein
MVLTLLIPLRRFFGFEEIITVKTLESIARTMVFMALILGYAYLVEYFLTWYGGNAVERETFLWRAVGHYAPLFWMMVLFNVAVPMAFFFRAVRTRIGSLFAVSILVNIGMWCERYVIIVGSVAHDFDPYVWGNYRPSWVELGILLGSFSVFFLFFLLFAKFLPSVSMVEMKEESMTDR